jgi:type IV pilus assembly protein PilN
MIKINLLPRKKRERRGINLDIYILITTLVVSLAVVGGVFLKNTRDIGRTRDEIESLKQQAKALEPIRKEFLTLEKDKKAVADKLTVIARMKEGRALPPRMLYDLSSLMKDNLWLKRLRKDEKKLEIEGRSIDNESVCDFVEHLSRLPYLKDLELKSVEDVGEGGMTVKKFIVDGSVSL